MTMRAYSVDHRAAARTPADSDDPVVVPDQLVDGEPFPQLRACGHGGVSEELVQHDAARRVGRVDTVSLLDGLGEREVTEIGREGAYRWAVRCDHRRGDPSDATARRRNAE